MFGENLKSIRKRQGYSQEELAIRLHVVRQTISKWEKSLSVPDADLLMQLSEVLEVSVNELLGANLINETDQSDIANQLSRINEQLAIKNRRAKLILKIILGIIISIIIFNLILIILSAASFSSYKSSAQNKITISEEITDID